MCGTWWQGVVMIYNIKSIHGCILENNMLDWPTMRMLYILLVECYMDSHYDNGIYYP